MRRLLLALAFSLLVTTVIAKETVTIYYAFSPADTMANYSRTLVKEANRIQNKYTFVFDTKPGAGNTVAANYVKNTPNTILATSSAFFIRPVFYPNESYSVGNFKELLPQCDAPMGVASLKYKSWKEVPTDRPVTIGVSGLGVTTHLVALQLASKYPNLQIVPFKSTNESIVATVGGQIDLTMGFINDEIRWTTKDTAADKRLTILGVTGTKTIANIAPLIKQGFPAILGSLNAPHHLVVPTTVPDAKFKEWREILFKASKAKAVQDSYAIDYAVPLDTISDDNIQPWYHKQDAQWKRLTSGVRLDK
jgi:tripartite-type tricarboxylate transporter receptor subunit TctC